MPTRTKNTAYVSTATGSTSVVVRQVIETPATEPRQNAFLDLRTFQPFHPHLGGSSSPGRDG